MPAGASPAEDFLRRVDAAMALERHTSAITGGAGAAPLTDADPSTGERWERGQVWAHLAEFVPYWTAQMREVVASYTGEPVPFGRVKSNPERIAAIERDRSAPVPELLSRLRDQVGELRVALRELPDGAWAARGRHQTLGDMTLDRIVDEFLVGHLEEHAAQLDGLK